MERDSTYYSSAIEYNELLAVAAENAAKQVEHPEVKKWCTAVGRQHRFHAKRHKAALAKLEEGYSDVSEPEMVGDGLDVPKLSVAEQQAEFAARHKDDYEPDESLDYAGSEEDADDEPDTNFHDSKTGQFVSEEYAEANPDTTVQVTEKSDGPADIALVASRMDEEPEGMFYNARGERITKQQYEEENA